MLRLWSLRSLVHFLRSSAAVGAHLRAGCISDCPVALGCASDIEKLQSGLARALFVSRRIHGSVFSVSWLIRYECNIIKMNAIWK